MVFFNHPSAASWLMEHQLETSKTWNPEVLLFLRTSPWGSTLAFGMPMTGLPEVVPSRLIGPTHHSLHLTETSIPTLVLHLLVPPAVLQMQLPAKMGGGTKNWILLAKRGWSGCSRTTWSTTTALIARGSLRVYLQSALLPERNKENEQYYSFIHFVDMHDNGNVFGRLSCEQRIKK